MTGHVATLGEGLGLVSADELGSFAHLDRARVGTGGAEGNVAVGLRRLGVAVRWVGRVGDDGLGRRVVRELRGEDVDVRAPVDPVRPTGLMLKERPRAGRSVVTYHRAGSAGSALSPADVALLDVPSAALLHVTGITPALSGSAADAVAEAVRVALEHGVPVSFDVNHRPSLWRDRDPRPVYRALAERATVVFAGDAEARLLVGGADDGELARALAGLGATEAVVKRGEEGAVAWAAGQLTWAPAVPTHVVDTVGAGDAFVAGYLSRLLVGASVADRLAVANRCGSLACQGAGDWESAPFAAELDDDHGDPVRR